MKTLLNVFMLCALSYGANAQLLLNDNFDYLSNDSLSENGWHQIGSSASNPIRSTGMPLTFTGYPATSNGVGNAAFLTTSGQDLFRDATATVNSGSAFASFLVKIASAQPGGDFFFALLPSTSSTTYTCRVFVKSSVNNGFFNVAITKNNESPVYATTDFALNETHLFYTEYIFKPAANNDDSIYLYVVPSGDPFPSGKPVIATASGFNTGQTDLANIGRVALRQGAAGNAATINVDGIRFGASWANGELPVQWKSFTGTHQKEGFLLEWSTASEINNSHFEIQRSVNNSGFDSIGFIKGSGNSINPVRYSFIDHDGPDAAIIYYRLRQVDADGRDNYSKTISMNRWSEQIVVEDLSPNPFNEAFGVNIEAPGTSMATIVVRDMTGTVHETFPQIIKSGKNQIAVRTTNLPCGMYLVQMTVNGAHYTWKAIKL